MHNAGLLRFIEAVPLILFLIFYRIVAPDASQNWLAPYLAGATGAVLTTSILCVKGVLLNRIFLGINIYLLVGCLGVVTQQSWLTQLYGELRASGMLAWVVVVGIASLLFTPSGFIGVDSASRKFVIVYSVCLLVVAVVVFLLAYTFRSMRAVSETIPFALLFLSYAALRYHAGKNIDTAQDPPRVTTG